MKDDFRIYDPNNLGRIVAGVGLGISLHCNKAQRSKEMTNFIFFPIYFILEIPILTLASETIAMNLIPLK